jgi:hypothetical protein
MSRYKLHSGLGIKLVTVGIVAGTIVDKAAGQFQVGSEIEWGSLVAGLATSLVSRVMIKWWLHE